MLSFKEIPTVYICSHPVDLRKGIDRYAQMIQDNFRLSPFEDALFIFTNKRRNKLKCLYYDGTGFWLLYKRLNQGVFQWEKDLQEDTVKISHQQLDWLLEGLDMHLKKGFERQTPKYI